MSDTTKAQELIEGAEKMLDKADRILDGREVKASEALTDLALIIDRSGSMHSTKDDAIGGMRHFVREQQAAPGRARLTVHHFDTQFDTLFEGKPLGDVEAESIGLDPRGGTALLDAIGTAISRAKDRAMRMRSDLAIFVIVTDGMENSSREWTKTGIKTLIEQCQRDYDWQFIFIGSNIDAVAEAQAIGIRAANAMNYADTHVSEAYAVMASNCAEFRSSGTPTAMCFSETDRAVAMGAEGGGATECVDTATTEATDSDISFSTQEAS